MVIAVEGGEYYSDGMMAGMTTVMTMTYNDFGGDDYGEGDDGDDNYGDGGDDYSDDDDYGDSDDGGDDYVDGDDGDSDCMVIVWL